eukprot:g36480.t1
MAKLDMENERRQREEYLKRKQKMKTEDLDELHMVDSIFSFLPTILADQEGQGPQGFEDVEVKQEKLEEFDLDNISVPSESDEEDDLTQYTFPKYAATYFQGSATHTHVQKALRHPLLYHEDEVDIAASLAVWNIILRFMGDLQEPKTFTQNNRTRDSSTITEIYDSQVKRSKEHLDMNQPMGQ